MGNLQKVVYLSESQAQELFTNETITVDGVTVNYSADDLYLTPDDSGNFVLKAGDTMTGALKAKGLRTYVSDTVGNASLNFGETADSTRVGRITMNTTTNIMEFDEGNERYLLPAPTASSETSYDIVTTNGSYTLGGRLNTKNLNVYNSSWPGIGFALSTDPTTAVVSLNYDDSNEKFTFISHPANDSTTTEAYTLPAPTYSDGSYHAFDILTSKTPVTVAQGGTGATTAADALTNLGAVNKAGDTMTGDLSITGGSAPAYYMKRSDGTPIGMLYSLVSSGRVFLRGYSSNGNYYNGFRIPDTSAITANADYDFLTTRDFKYNSVNQSSGTIVGFVGSGAGVWIVGMYDSADAAKYWIGAINKKSGENPVVTTIANATIGAPWGNTVGTIVFSGASGNYVVQGIKIV